MMMMMYYCALSALRILPPRVFCVFRPFEEQAQKEEDSLVKVVGNNAAKEQRIQIYI